jgi:hypothetical protein
MSEETKPTYDEVVDRLEAVLVRERLKEGRIKELEGIIAKLQKEKDSNPVNQSVSFPSNINVTHKLDFDTKKTLMTMGIFAGPGRQPSKWYTSAKDYFSKFI